MTQYKNVLMPIGGVAALWSTNDPELMDELSPETEGSARSGTLMCVSIPLFEVPGLPVLANACFAVNPRDKEELFDKNYFKSFNETLISSCIVCAELMFVHFFLSCCDLLVILLHRSLVTTQKSLSYGEKS